MPKKSYETGNEYHHCVMSWFKFKILKVFFSHDLIWIKFQKCILSRELIWIKTFWDWVESNKKWAVPYPCLLVSVTCLWSWPFPETSLIEGGGYFFLKGFHFYLIPTGAFIHILILWSSFGMPDYLLLKFHLIWIHLPMTLVRAVRSKFLKEVWAFSAQLVVYWGMGDGKEMKTCILFFYLRVHN